MRVRVVKEGWGKKDEGARGEYVRERGTRLRAFSRRRITRAGDRAI